MDFRKHSGQTPADDMAAQIITDCGNFTLDFKQHGFCASPLFLRLWDLDFQIKCKIYFHLKEDFGPLSNSPVLLLLSPGKTLWRCFCFRSGLVALFLKILSVVTLDALTPASVYSLWSSPKCLNWLCLTYSQDCGHPCCLCTLSYPISSFQSTLHLICFDTALLEQPPLSVMTLCDVPSLWRVSMIVFWTIAKSAVFPIIVVSKNKIPKIFTVWMVIYWNSNVIILIFWDIDFWLFCKL